jgi:hypothetical protein
VVNQDILFASRNVDLEIKSVQTDITHTTKPGLAAEALKMKTDLQSLKEKLEQISSLQ